MFRSEEARSRANAVIVNQQRAIAEWESTGFDSRHSYDDRLRDMLRSALTFEYYRNAPIHGCCAALWRHAGSSVGVQLHVQSASRHPPTHRTPTVPLATPAIGAFGLNRGITPIGPDDLFLSTPTTINHKDNA